MRRINDRREVFGPPRGYWSKTLDNFRELTPELEAAIDEIWKFPDYPEDGPDLLKAKYRTMILAGPTGTGKTHCLAALYNYSRENLSDDMVFRRCIELGRDLKAARPSELIELMQRYGDGHVLDPSDENDNGCYTLLLDDLGVDCDEATVTFITEILDRRTSADLETIITTNMTDEELREMFDERGYSRLMFRCKWVPMPGADYRLEGAR